MNIAHLIGRVGTEMKTREVGETKVVSFSLATTERWKDKSGEKKEKTYWHNVEVWGKLADVFIDYVNKGDLIQVSGSYLPETYDNKDGEKRFTAKLRLTGFTFLPNKRDEDKKPKASPESREDPEEDDGGDGGDGGGPAPW